MFEHEAKTATTTRLTKESGEKTWESTGQSFHAFLQPLGTEDAAFYEGSFAKASKCYIKGVGHDIQKRDRITIDGTEYEIRSIQEFNFGQKHTKLFIEYAET